jgi:hypothetical protein
LETFEDKLKETVSTQDKTDIITNKKVTGIQANDYDKYKQDKRIMPDISTDEKDLFLNFEKSPKENYEEKTRAGIELDENFDLYKKRVSGIGLIKEPSKNNPSDNVLRLTKKIAD